jgi:hypothetical protein
MIQGKREKSPKTRMFDVLVTCYSVRQARWSVVLPVQAETEEEARAKAEALAHDLDEEDEEDAYDPTLEEIESTVIARRP